MGKADRCLRVAAFGVALYWTLAAFSLVADIMVDGARQLGPGEGVSHLLTAKLNDLIILPFIVAMIFIRRAWFHGAFIVAGVANIAWLTISVALKS